MGETELLSLEQVAEKLKVSRKTVWRWTQEGYRGRKLETRHAGRALRTTWDAVLAFMEKKK